VILKSNLASCLKQLNKLIGVFCSQINKCTQLEAHAGCYEKFYPPGYNDLSPLEANQNFGGTYRIYFVALFDDFFRLLN
jgi:hypothetical protein